jgi:hypothetical protein
MSQRDSGYERKERDLYETPEWVTTTRAPDLPVREPSGLQQEGRADEAHPVVRGFQGLAVIQSRLVHLGLEARGSADARHTAREPVQQG